MRKPLIIALATVTFALNLPAGAETGKELFPVRRGVNAERGFAVAVDGTWLALGAPREDAAERKDAGVVYLFHWSGKVWELRDVLTAELPQPNAQLGFALAMRNGVLAAGAPGEVAGAVYLFVENDGAWTRERRLAVTGLGAGTFGRSLALDGSRLAVGAVDVHGETDGAVYVYAVGSWAPDPPVRPRPRQKGERFGSAVSLAGDLLVVGAPGYDSGSGAAYVFQRWTHRWREKKRILPPDGPSPAGQQFGSAVAIDGAQIFVGAPTADPADPDEVNTGAVHWFARSAAGWDHQGLLEAADLIPGDQLGSSLALSGDFLVAGAPAPPPGTGTGRIHLFRRDGASWEEARLVPGNAETRDLAGFAAAVDGGRVVVGGVLGDQGSGAAGAAWSFRCPAGDACTEEAEAVVRDTATGTFGASVALTEQYLAVGSPAPDDNSAGRVYLYRPARRGWRQEASLFSPLPSLGDPGFGASVALDSERLAVGAPRSRLFETGAVYLFSHAKGSWASEKGFQPEPPVPEWPFGTSVAVAGNVVVIGAQSGDLRGAVYVLEKTGDQWPRTGFLTRGSGESEFGAALALGGGLMAIGAPGGDGAVHLAIRGPAQWGISKTLPGVQNPDIEPRIGTSLAIGGGVLAVGAPGAGLVYLVKDIESGRAESLAPGGEALPGFGTSLALMEEWLAVGAPDPQGQGRAFLFELGSEAPGKQLLPREPLAGDRFGAAVALSSHFAVVTSPGRGDRVTVFELLPEEGENP